MKNISLKSISIPMNYPTCRYYASMVGKLFPKSHLVQTKSCPDAPYFFINLQSLMSVVLPRQLFKALPGNFFRQWLLNWYSKIIVDYNEITIALADKIDKYKIAYFEWMEHFMEMDNEFVFTEKHTPRFTSERFSNTRTTYNNPTTVLDQLNYARRDAISKLAGGFEKILILFHRIFSSGPVPEIPMLEIVNAGAIKCDVPAIKKPINNKWPEITIRQILKPILQKLNSRRETSKEKLTLPGPHFVLADGAIHKNISLTYFTTRMAMPPAT